MLDFGPLYFYKNQFVYRNIYFELIAFIKKNEGKDDYTHPDLNN